jgi:NodT family efflux transporter outer membrane factor (OMF) lipoprotein
MMGASCLLSACIVGPDYKRPPVKMPAHFKETKHSKLWKVAKPNDICARGDWWEIFHDNQLSSLENRLNQGNQSIAAADANYRQARALVDEARASYYPTLSGTVSIIRQKGAGSTNVISSTGGSASSGIAATSHTPVRTNQAIIFNASWQPDIWGLVHRTVEASAAGAQADAALLAATRLSLQASLATFYFELRALDSDQHYLDAIVAANKKILAYTLNEYRAGTASRAAVLAAQANLQAAQELAINNGVNRATFEHAIAVLIGVPPENLSIKRYASLKKPPKIPVSIPSTLLERRPDVAQAERLMAQANAEIGVATAAYFPALNIIGNASFIGTSFKHLLALPNLGWAYGPQLTQLIYDGGLRSATVRAARAGYDSTVASYREVVLAALQNVEDNLSTLRILSNQGSVQDAAAVTARKELKIVRNEYHAGTVDRSAILTAEINVYNQEKSASDVTGLRLTAAVSLIVALGGNWNVHSIDHAADAC